MFLDLLSADRRALGTFVQMIEWFVGLVITAVVLALVLVSEPRHPRRRVPVEAVVAGVVLFAEANGGTLSLDVVTSCGVPLHLTVAVPDTAISRLAVSEVMRWVAEGDPEFSVCATPRGLRADVWSVAGAGRFDLIACTGQR